MKCAWVLMVVWLALGMGACTPGRTHMSAGAAGDVARGAYPFAPASLRVHPLTHVELNEAGTKADAKAEKGELILHFELLDKFADSVKGLGTLKVELYRPGAGMNPGIETQELTWDVPGMDDAERNTRRFDMATRTYRVPLVTPKWVGEAISRDTGPGWVKVRVVLTVSGESGDRKLEDEYVIQG